MEKKQKAMYVQMEENIINKLYLVSAQNKVNNKEPCSIKGIIEDAIIEYLEKRGL